MFRALLAHPQESLHKRHLVYCVRSRWFHYTDARGCLFYRLQRATHCSYKLQGRQKLCNLKCASHIRVYLKHHKMQCKLQIEVNSAHYCSWQLSPTHLVWQWNFCGLLSQSYTGRLNRLRKTTQIARATSTAVTSEVRYGTFVCAEKEHHFLRNRRRTFWPISKYYTFKTWEQITSLHTWNLQA
jgi:hypothetical protein